MIHHNKRKPNQLIHQVIVNMARFMEQFGRQYRELIDPLEELTAAEFLSRYRLSKETVEDISQRIDDNIATVFGRPIPTHMKICALLRFLACGTFQQVVGDTFNMSQSSCSRSIWQVSNVVNCVYANEVIQFTPENSINVQRQSFYNIANFPRVIGCIDGTHIRIQAPTNNPNAYINRKGYHSINTMAVCDAHGKFTYVSSRWPGSCHDSFILRSSRLWDVMERGEVYADCVILGDQGYPCRRWLMTPYNNPRGNQVAFNNSLSKTRSKIECAFGILKKRFNCFHQELRFTPEKCSKIITTGIIFHNLAIERNEPLPNENIEALIEDEDPVVNQAIIGDNQRGAEIRNAICDHFF